MAPVQKPGKSKQDYRTPPELIEAIQGALLKSQFVGDLAASAENTVCPDYYITPEENSLVQPWHMLVKKGWYWLNPPFGDITPWVKKCAEESMKGVYIACLVPSSVGSNWWHNYVQLFAYALHLNPRLTFVGCDAPYPKDCSLLLYQPAWLNGSRTWKWK